MKRSWMEAGVLPIPVTGYRAPLQECLSEGLAHAVRYLKDEGIAAQSLVEAEPERSPETSRAILRRVSRLLQFVVDNGYRGIVLIIDELGKPLEFAAAHPEEADIYLLQELAEFANRSANSPVVVIGILHQAFERYAVFLDSVTQQEWAKVQGRFEDIPSRNRPFSSFICWRELSFTRMKRYGAWRSCSETKLSLQLPADGACLQYRKRTS